MSSRTRIEIPREVHRKSQHNVTSLGEEPNLSKSTVSAHLDTLSNAA